MTAQPSNPDAEEALNQPPPEVTGPLGWQLALPGGLLVLGVLILVASTRFPDTAAAKTSPGLYPGIVAVVLIVACLMSVVELLTVRRRYASSNRVRAEMDEQERRTGRITWARALSVTVLSIGYVVLIPNAGFVVTTLIYTFVISLMLRGWSPRGVVGAALIAACLVAAAYYAFAVGLNAPLPRGRWF